MLKNKKEILLKIIDVLYSINENFCINTHQHGDGTKPNWAGHRSLTDGHFEYNISLYLDDDNVFDVSVIREQKLFYYLRKQQNRYVTVIKRRELLKKYKPSRLVYDIEFEYDKKELQDLQKKIFDYFEEKNYYNLNYNEIMQSKLLEEKSDECLEILNNSVGKKIKRERTLTDILEEPGDES